MKIEKEMNKDIFKSEKSFHIFSFKNLILAHSNQKKYKQTMKFEYKIELGDFLEFQLFNASRDTIIQKRKVKGWILLSIGCALLAIFSFFSDALFLSLYFVALAIVIVFFYPIYFNWRYKKQYGNFILRNYSKSFGEIASLEITDQYLLSEDKIENKKIKITDIELVSETSKHFFLKTTSGMTFILPKRELPKGIDLRKKFAEIKVVVQNELDWKW